MDIFKLNKTFLLISAFVIIVILIIVFVLINKSIGPINQDKIQQIYSQDVYYPIIKDDKMLFFTNIDNQPGIYSLDIGSKETEKIIDCPTPLDIIWSPDKTKAIVKVRYYDGAFYSMPAGFRYFAKEGQIFNYSLDLQTKKINRLNKGIVDIIWKNNQQIIYSYKNTDQEIYTINEADFSGNNWKKLIALDYNFENIKLQLANNILYYQNPPSDIRNTELNSYNLETTKSQKILEEVYDFSFSPNGNYLLTNKSNNIDQLENYSIIDTENHQKITDLTDLRYNYQFIWDENDKIYYIEKNTLFCFDLTSNKKKTIVKNDILDSNMVLKDQNNNYLYLYNLENNAVYQIKK